MADLSPFVLFEYEDHPGDFCLMLADAHVPDDCLDVFEDRGELGNGYGWSGVARAAIARFMPELSDTFDFDSEAGTFVAHSRDRAALERLGAELLRIMEDLELLGELIDEADPDWFD